MGKEEQPFVKLSHILVNIVTTVAPCLAFIWGLATETRLMDMRIAILEKLIATSVQDRAQLHEMISGIEKKNERQDFLDESCAKEVLELKEQLKKASKE